MQKAFSVSTGKLILALLLVTFALPLSTLAQSFDSWRGLRLDETTPAVVLEKFEKPKEDKSGVGFRPLKYDEWFIKDKNYRMIHFENIEGFSDVMLYFRDDKLVVIHLEPKNLKASLLPQTYNADFDVLVSGIDKAAFPNDTETVRGKNYPKHFPQLYWLMHRAEKSICFVMVGNNSARSILGSLGASTDDMNSFPGNAEQIQLISNSIRNTKGSDLLK